MFDSPEELLAKIRLGEDSVLEFKAVYMKGAKVDAPERDDLADELAAIANNAAGVMLLGVDDKTREVIGIPINALDAVERLVADVCRDSIKPPLHVNVLRMELPDSAGTARAIVKVDVPKGPDVHKSPGGYFRREGSSKRELTTDALVRLKQLRGQSGIVRFDELAVPNTTPDTLAPDLWGKFRGELADPRDVLLRKLKLITVDDSGVLRATIGGVLLCTEHPEAWIPNAVIEAVHYASPHPDSNYQVDARTITGPLDRQVFEALAFVERNMSIAARKDPGRSDYPQYHLRAVFEAIVNAVVHRDYSIHQSKIRLFMHPDRLVLMSPGALANTLTVESLPHLQATRNELIASLLAKMPAGEKPGIGRTNILEKRGEGVPLIIRETRALAGAAPIYQVINDAEVQLTIPAARPPKET